VAKVTSSLNYLNEVDVKAFLKLIRYCEHHRREDPGVYYVLYGGGHFTDISTHPLPKAKQIRDRYGEPHSPAGAYQIIFKTWKGLKERDIVHDFSPISQDKAAIQIIKDFSALEDVRHGDIQIAIPKLRGQWSSFPGGSQEQIKMDEAVKVFNRFVMEYSKK
jgi:muramidase (phage lysozyme)